MIPTENWPKSWMLAVHAQAVERGFIWLEPISEADADSFTRRFYRIRRRSDKSMAAFIPAEYHLVTVGSWEPGPDGTGRLPVTFSARPDGVPLPLIRAATGDEVAATSPAPQLADPPPMTLEADSLKIDSADIDGLIANLRKSAKERREES